MSKPTREIMWGADFVSRVGGGYCRVTKKTPNIWVESRVAWASANVNGVAANVGFSFLIKVLFVGLFVFVNMMISCSVDSPPAFLFCENTCPCYKIEYVSADGN